jgi:hypothetical protein
MTEPVTIRTGTRDELNGVDVGFVNVFERDERPGVTSVMLVLPDRQVVLTAGDAFEVDGAAFRLEAIEQVSGAYAVKLLSLSAPSVRPPIETNLPLAPVAAHALRALLKQLTPAILGVLARGGPVPALVQWIADSSQSFHTEWTGAQLGPNSTSRDSAAFDPSVGVQVEATITIEEIRYSPDELYRREVSAFWRLDDVNAHVFLRAEGEAKFDHITGADLDPAILALIRQAIART